MLKTVMMLLGPVVPIHKVDAGERNHKQSIPLILRLLAQVKLYSNPYSCISNFFDEDMIESFDFQTKLYCTQKGRAGSITKDELYAFFEINILMAYYKLSTLKRYCMKANHIVISLI